jgi:hypothetical protein
VGSFANCAMRSRLEGSLRPGGKPYDQRLQGEPVTNWRARHDLPAAHAFGGRIIAIPFGTIEMSESHFQGCLRRLFGREQIGDERAKPDRSHGAGSMVKWDLRVAKPIGVVMLTLLRSRRPPHERQRGFTRRPHFIPLSPTFALDRRRRFAGEARDSRGGSTVRGKCVQVSTGNF